VDYKTGNFNFALKYEFNTEMKMKNHSTLDKAMEIDAINKFQDGTEVNEDAPALLTVGAQWSVRPDLRVSLGYHHYYDKNANWYGNAQDKLSKGTNEYLAGVDWDVSDRINISAGGQLTRYGLTDEYMNDMSFVVNSYSVGAGITYKVSDHVKVSAAYFQTNYTDYKRNNYPVEGVSDTFTRTNRVLGLGCQLDF
jgi:long-subunit fatty acid transport protein